MKLYITAGSPYARTVRIVILEKGLAGRVEVLLAPTRQANSPYYKINPSGRVPYLIRDDGVAMEESGLIVAYLDHLDGKPLFDWPTGNTGEASWEPRRIDALAHSLVDGLAVWSRELARHANERSPTTLAHEAALEVTAGGGITVSGKTVGDSSFTNPLDLAGSDVTLTSNNATGGAIGFAGKAIIANTQNLTLNATRIATTPTTLGATFNGHL